MLTEEKIKQTRRLISKGLPEGEIKNQLKEEGFSEEEIKEIFKPKPYDMRSWLLFFGIMVSLYGLYAGYLLLVILGVLLLWQYYKLDMKAKQQEAKKTEPSEQSGSGSQE